MFFLFLLKKNEAVAYLFDDPLREVCQKPYQISLVLHDGGTLATKLSAKLKTAK